MSNDQIKIEARPIGDSTQITGYVGTNEVIVIGGGPDDPWHVGMSSCLPVSIDRAALYLECMARVMDRAREYGAIFKRTHDEMTMKDAKVTPEFNAGLGKLPEPYMYLPHADGPMPLYRATDIHAAVAAERDQCAKLCEAVLRQYGDASSGEDAARACVAAIRSRVKCLANRGTTR